uniref:Tantalus domain-containing protein n=1 Tax=Glossina pallidipes TaxID=7398 RepID=A0A1A9ZSB6_GLOPL
MDRVVLGIANINFQQENSKKVGEGPALTRCQITSIEMEPLKGLLDKTGQWRVNHINSDKTMGNVNSAQEIQVVSHENTGGAKISRDDRRTNAFIERRILIPRASKDESAFGNKRRSIMKPSKPNNQKIKDFTMLRPRDIKRIYMKKTKLTNFKPSALETIFEEPNALQGNDIDELEHARLIGNRKIKRYLSCHNGLDQNKALANKRRAKIKKTFSGRSALIKVSLEEFLKKLNERRDKEENVVSVWH